MGKNYCAVKDCHNVSGRIGRFGKPVKLHELPKKQHLRTAWLRAISRKHFNPKRTRGRISLSKLEAHINRRHLTCYKNALSSTNQDPLPCLPLSLSLSLALYLSPRKLIDDELFHWRHVQIAATLQVIKNALSSTNQTHFRASPLSLSPNAYWLWTFSLNSGVFWPLPWRKWKDLEQSSSNPFPSSQDSEIS